MKKAFFIILILSHYFLATSQDMKGMEMTKKEATKKVQATIYTCPMHTEIHADKAGNCPKCGMNLTKMKGEKMEKDSAGMKM